MGPKIILMCGIPASGKSTYIRASMEREGVFAIRVSRDDIRRALVGEDVNNSSYFSKEGEVFSNFVNLINESIDDDVEDIYIDATHINPPSRKKVLSRIKNRENLNLEVVVLTVPLEVAQARNSKRTGFAKVPKTAIANMARDFVLPTIEEFAPLGFKSVNIKGE